MISPETSQGLLTTARLNRPAIISLGAVFILIRPMGVVEAGIEYGKKRIS